MTPKIAFVGDLHGEWARLRALAESHPELDAVVQVGDFGFYPETLKRWARLPWPVYALDGNHEHFPLLKLDAPEPYEVADGLFHLPRGIVFNLHGVRLGCLGGAESLDKAWREFKVSWWPEERIMPDQANRLLGAKVDLLVTHCPPAVVIVPLFEKLRPHEWRLPPDWRDVSAEQVDRIWRALDFPPLVCGHMHGSKRADNVRVLAIEEVVDVAELIPARAPTGETSVVVPGDA